MLRSYFLSSINQFANRVILIFKKKQNMSAIKLVIKILLLIIQFCTSIKQFYINMSQIKMVILEQSAWYFELFWFYLIVAIIINYDYNIIFYTSFMLQAHHCAPIFSIYTFMFA